MMFRHLIYAAALLIASPVFADNLSFKDVVKKVEARAESTKVRRGEAVVWTLTIEILDGWHTYPTKQADPMADSYENKIKFANDDNVVFVGGLTEPTLIEKNEDGVKVAMVEKLGVWKRTFVVRPDAKPGKVKVPVKVTILACADRCLQPQTIATEVELTVTDDPPVAVDPKYRAEVNAPRK